MENIQEVLRGWFKFRKWSAYERDPKEFENDLTEFGTFAVYENFKEFLDKNDYLLENAGEDIINIDYLLSSRESFNDFMESINTHTFNKLSYENMNNPFLFGEANTFENPIHFESLENIKTESDLFSFLNDVLKDLGEVTHSLGLKPEYEVTAVS